MTAGVAIAEGVSRYKVSGENDVMGFCRKHGLDYQRFRYHLKGSISSQPAGGAGFAGIVVCEKAFTYGRHGKSPASVAGLVRLSAGGRVRLEVEGSFTATFLRELVGC